MYFTRLLFATGFLACGISCVAAEKAPSVCRELTVVGALPELPEEKNYDKRISDQRACLKSYSSGFGDAEGDREQQFVKAPAAALKADLVVVEALFDSTPDRGRYRPDESDNQWQRRYHVSHGWDKQQVMLWGNFFYLRRLLREREYSKVISSINELKEKYPISAIKIASWNSAERNTYFSKDQLANMILALEYSARQTLLEGSSNSPPKSLALNFLRDRPALYPFFKISNDPTDGFRELYCR